MAGLVLRGVEKAFGAAKILHGVDLAVADGEFVVFVGPSGCGKSTLLRVIAGLEDVTAGDVLIDGASVVGVPASDRGLAMVFQSYALYPHMTVRQNMAFALENLGMARAEIDARVGRAAAMLRLDALLERRPKALSGGQRQRVAIGRAIVRDPKIFLFDEPLSNLDAELRVATRREIAALHETLGGTMIYVTHDQVEAMTLASRIVVLNAGRVEQVGTPLDLYNRPDNLFVAGFIGSPRMNLLPATVAAGGRVRIGAATDVAVPEAAGLPEGAAVTLGVRPEHLAIAPGEAGTGDGVQDGLAATIELAERLGGETFLYAAAPGLPQLAARVDGQSTCGRGDRVTVRVAGPTHLFDDGGRAIRAH